MHFNTALRALSLVIALTALPEITPAQELERLFYYVDREDAFNSLVRNIKSISVLAPSSFSVDEQGIVWGAVDSKVLELARRNNVKVMPLLVNTGFEQEPLHRFLSSAEARIRAIRSMVELCKQHDFWGFQIDLENVDIEDRDALTVFYRDAARALHAAGRKISIAVVHRPEELAGPTRYHKWLFANWRAGYDIKALADAGDFVTVMTYSQHTRRTPPGPNAALPWAEEVVKYFLQFMPAEKLSLGIPTGGMRWYTSQEDRITPELARSYSETLSHAWALHIIERNNAKLLWHDDYKVSYAFFPVGGTFEHIFLEDARSFEAKLGLARKHRLRGFSVWVLGPEDPGIWNHLRQ
jgi:spore germination protein YaaH